MMRLTDYWEVASVARESGVPRTTILSAIERGDIKTKQLGSGTIVVRLEDVIEFANGPERRGRPKSKKP